LNDGPFMNSLTNSFLADLQWGKVLGFWPVLLVSFVVALATTPICRTLALQLRSVDRPDDFLKPHQKPIPYLGGVAIFLGWVAGVLIALRLASGNVRMPLMLGIAMAGLLIMLIGLFDDLRYMRPKVKLFCNVAVAVYLVYLGLGSSLVTVFTQSMGVEFAASERWLILTYSAPVAVFIIVGSCNATNLIDGLDGLCTGVLSIISLGFFILAAYMGLYREGEPWANEMIVLSLAILGASLGFLPFNWNPATIFMGDAGSMLLGLNAAMIMLLFAEDQQIAFMMAALMVFGLPIGDMLLTMARRWRNGRPLMEGDRSHFYDQLRDRGLSVRRVVAISYILTLVFVAVGTCIVYPAIRMRHAVLIYFIWIVVVIGLVWKFNMASIERDAPKADLPVDAPENSDAASE